MAGHDTHALSFVMAAAFGALLASADCTAQPVKAPVRPGLWEVDHSRESDGQKSPSVSEHMSKLPPSVRQQVEQDMKARGMRMGANGASQICLTAERLSRDDWSGDRETGCKTEVLSRTKELWKWRATCSGPIASTSEGETHFKGDTAYTTVVDTTMEQDGRPHKTRMQMNGKWLSADCGDLKPTEPMEGAASRSRR